MSIGGRPVADDVIEIDSKDLFGLVFTFTARPTRVSGSVVDAKGAADPDSDVVIFPADTTLWREGIFSDRRMRKVHATSVAAFEFSGLAPGEYYLAAVNAGLTMDLQDLQLDRLIAGAIKITLGEGEDRTVPLKVFLPRGR